MGAPQGNEIRTSEDPRRILRPEGVQNFDFPLNFRFSKFSTSCTNPMVSVSAGGTNLFSDITTGIESPNRGQYRKNTPGRNEFTDFEQFGVEHPPRIKSILAIHSANYPGNGITLRTTALRVTCNNTWARRKAMKFAPARTHDGF